MGESTAEPVRRVRADAQRSRDALREAAREVFAVSGVDAPVREIAERAGVGLGTVYRHFPQRSDLVAAVFQHAIDRCAAAAREIAAQHPPLEALRLWLDRYIEFMATKRGLAAALHSGDPAFATLPAYFDRNLRPALVSLLDAAAAAGQVRRDVAAEDLLMAVANLCLPAEGDPEHTRRMVSLLVDGLRFGAGH
ncbi:TetR/AcrR family transcriptional regulator [Actinoplanes sp. HUAS TT8]|uniref:TetR/AcrR family transcriptional regulator n=1 Tax=Actinoplanes sp. HUAS TT8 TaxID=3447453 RepID=UPI003F524927